MITDPIHTKSAFLIWQSPLGETGSRRRLPVAFLRDDGEGVSFEYLKDDASYRAAEEEGFRGYYGIPVDREDTSDAIHTLIRRLPSKERPDYANFLGQFGLLPEHDLPPLSLLAYTGGRQTSDGFSFSDTFEGFDRPFEYIFDVAGRRHSIEATPQVVVGDFAEFREEPDNRFDPDAVEIVDSEGARLGYVNACQANAVKGWLKNGTITGSVFRVNGRPSYPRLFIKATIDPT